MTGKRRRGVRIATAIAIALPAFLGSLGSSSATTTKADVAAAKAKLEQINHQLDVLSEQFNQAQIALQQTQTKLAAARAKVEAAQKAAQKAKDDLATRAVTAYTSVGSQVDVLLGAQSLTEFSDRLEFMGRLAQSDADLANQANVAEQQSKWAADQYSATLAQEQKQAAALQGKVDAIKKAAAQQAALYKKTSGDYQAALAAEKVAEAAAAAGDGSGGGGGGGYTAPPPPPNTSAAQTAIYYAKSVEGTQYVWGAADPNVGFDCSGLVMWSYAHAGIYLPHSSLAMYGMLPHVSREQLVPGDLLFFYSPVSHVGLYIGGDQMIDASHPGPGGEVDQRTIYWDNFVAGGRIG